MGVCVPIFRSVSFFVWPGDVTHKYLSEFKNILAGCSPHVDFDTFIHIIPSRKKTWKEKYWDFLAEREKAITKKNPIQFVLKNEKVGWSANILKMNYRKRKSQWKTQNEKVGWSANILKMNFRKRKSQWKIQSLKW